MNSTYYSLSLSPQPYSLLSSWGESGSGSNSPPTIPLKRKAGRKKFKETRHPIYRGVRQRDGGKWVCEIREPNKKSRIWVGTYPSPELAGRAYDVAALALRGNLAALNFPDSAWVAPRAKSSSARDIRLAALEATRMDLISSSSSSSLPSSSKGSKSEQDREGSKRSEMECVMKKDLEDSRRMFLDEEAIFNMPCLIDSMAEAMLLTPPALKRGTTWDDFDDEGANSFIELDLWR